jgi:multimeric flavodoxin WrbA
LTLCELIVKFQLETCFSMKILGLVGSPRRESNTDLLVSAILEGAKTNNHITEKIYLYNANILPCVDCKACKKDSFQCALNDEMQGLYSKLQEADVLVFGTPLYWYGPSAKMKLLVDRLRPFIASKRLAGKKAVLIVPSEEGADACNLVVGMFNLSFKYLGINLVGTLLPTASERAEVKNQPETLNKALDIGKSL